MGSLGNSGTARHKGRESGLRSIPSYSGTAAAYFGRQPVDLAKRFGEAPPGWKVNGSRCVVYGFWFRAYPYSSLNLAP